MRRRTTTAQINAALPMMEVIKAEYYNKDTYTTTDIDTATFTENLQFLAESAYADACRPGNPRDTSVEEIKALYLSLM